MARGRFAPTPSGRMHLGNLFSAFLAYLSAKSHGGDSILRIEDLDSARCHFGNNAEVLKDDLRFLGFEYTSGWEEESHQSRRFSIYREYVEHLRKMGLLYPCYCSRAELHAATAPHDSDGNPIYDGRCRRLYDAGIAPTTAKAPAYRLRVPDETVTLTDGVQGIYTENLATDSGDFVVQRSDGIYAYQLAVVVDDGLSSVTEVVRGRDLLSSAPRQAYLASLLGFKAPSYYHVPLLLSPDGRRLSKRDGDIDMSAFRKSLPTPEPLLGFLAYHAGLIDRMEALTLDEALSLFSWKRVPKDDIPIDKAALSSILS